MIPLWQVALITLADGLIGGAIVCGLVALGIKRGFKKLDEREKNT